MSNEHYNFFGLTSHGADMIEEESRRKDGKPCTVRAILKIIDDCFEKQKEMYYNSKDRKRSDLHDRGMLDGMLVIQAAVNGNPWPL